MASYAPRKAPLGIEAAFLVVEHCCLLARSVTRRSEDFSRKTFITVFKWPSLPTYNGGDD